MAALRRVVLAASLALLALPVSPAQAQQRSVASPGHEARIAVDRDGNAHLTLIQTTNGQDVTVYCRLSETATRSCPQASFSYPPGPNQGVSTGAYPLLPGDGRVLVLDSRCCTEYAAKFLYTSTDGGTSFGPGVAIGDDSNSGASILGGAQYLDAGAIGRPQESILTFSSLATLGLSLHATGTTGPPTRTTRANVITQGNATSGTFGLQGDRLVAAWSSIDDGNVYWRAWSGSGDVNDQASWTPITPLAPGTETRIAGGPGGVYLAYVSGERIVVRALDGSGWSEPVTLAETVTAGPFDLVQGADGSLHFAGRDRQGNLRYRRSTAADPLVFSSPATLVDANAFGFRNPRLGVGPAGDTWIAWEDSDPSVVHALAFDGPPPPPVRGETVNAVPVKGRVLVKLPRGAAAGKVRGAQSGFVPLESIGRQLPVGSILDTKRGTVRLTTARTSNGTKTQNGRFNGGLFSVDQGRKNPLTTLSMRGGGLSACSRLPRGGARKATDAPASATARRRRRIFGNARGRFRTRGRNSVASVRGTKWSMTDSCRGTLTRVTQGTVIVRDLTLRKNRRLRAGDRYLAKPPRRRR